MLNVFVAAYMVNNVVYRELEKRNQLSFVCIFLVLYRNW